MTQSWPWSSRTAAAAGRRTSSASFPRNTSPTPSAKASARSADLRPLHRGAYLSQFFGRVIVYRVAGNDHAVVLARDRRCEQTVEHVVEHGRGLAPERIAVTAAARPVGDQTIARCRLLIGHLRRQRQPGAVTALHDELARIAVAA